MLGLKKSDASLVKAAQKGDAVAWDNLIRRYESLVFNTAWRIVGNREDAADLMQDVLLTVYNKLDRFEAKAAFKTWLLRITSNRSIDCLRRRKPEDQIENEFGETLLSNDDSPLEKTMRNQSNQWILDMLEQLPPEQRLVVELKFFQGMTFEEMAETLEVSTNTLKSRLYAALRKMKNNMEVVHAL